jgi:hypothetical protein
MIFGFRIRMFGFAANNIDPIITRSRISGKTIALMVRDWLKRAPVRGFVCREEAGIGRVFHNIEQNCREMSVLLKV